MHLPPSAGSLIESGGSIRDAVAPSDARSRPRSPGGNKSRDAKLLDISRFALQRKLDKYGMGGDGEDDVREAPEAVQPQGST